MNDTVNKKNFNGNFRNRIDAIIMHNAIFIDIVPQKRTIVGALANNAKFADY